MMSLVTHHLLFTAEVTTPLEVDNQCGSALRGNFYEAVWRRFCTNKASPACATCMLHTLCPVSALVAPLREESAQGQDIPRPYIVLPPLGEARRYEPGETLLFGLTLFGSMIQLLPYIMLSIEGLEAAGLGRKLKEHNWQRGTLKVKRVQTYQPFSGEKRCLYEQGKHLVQAPTLSVTPADVQARAASLSSKRLTLKFLTPLRLVDQKHLVHQVAFVPLIHRLIQRLQALEVIYGAGGSDPFPFEEKQSLLSLADRVQCSDDATSWHELESYSRRLKRRTPTSGLIGQATFSGDLAPFRELLTWGELIHVGKSCVKGNGWYKLVD